MMETYAGASISSNSIQSHQQRTAAQDQVQYAQPASAISSSSALAVTSSPLSANSQQAQQQPLHSSLASASLSTPDAHWSASSNFSSAPELTVSSEAVDQADFFDSITRPYTPSYNSTTSALDGPLSDQEDYWSGAGSQLEGVEFDFGPDLYKGQASLGSTIAYDPETADNYNNLEGALLAAQAFGTTYSGSGQGDHSLPTIQTTDTSSQQTSNPASGLAMLSISDQHQYRDRPEKSPIASPLLGATSPSRTRHSSFGSNIGSPAPAQDNEQNWMQSLGQRMSLGEGIPAHFRQNRPNNSQQSTHSQSASVQSLFEPVFEEDGLPEVPNNFGPAAGQHFSSYTYAHPPSEQQYKSESQEMEEAQPPLLSIGDTTMQEAAFELNNRGYEGQSWAPGSSWQPMQDDYHPLTRPNAQQSTMAAPPPSRLRPSAQQGVQPPRRVDSNDPMRKFLRLDVDMGFVSQPQHYSGLAVPVRKRSNSDFGPSYFGFKEEEGVSSPLFTVVPGGVTDKTPTALVSGVDWAEEAARQRKLQAAGGNNNQVVMSMQQNGTTMDPHLLQQQQQQQQYPSSYQQAQQPRYTPASGPIRQRDVSNARGTAGPYQHNRTTSSGASGATPWTPLSPTAPPPGTSGTRFAPSPQSAMQPASLRRSNSASRHHRRGAQSEDLSQLARSSNPSEFLNRITAPDGSLAPPNALSNATVYSNFENAASAQHRLQPYQTSHDRYQSKMASQSAMTSSPSNNDKQQPSHDQSGMLKQFSGARTMGSMEPPSAARAGINLYSQTALPTYVSMSMPTGSESLASHTNTSSAGELPMASFQVPVVQVTTSATQAASASRRKNEAIHICPIPGCGSTFTRKFNLNGHIRSHTGARPYECREPGCGKSFARSFDLSRHEKLHAGIKPHTCENCGKAFARADALSRHLRNDAGNGGCSAGIAEQDEDDFLAPTTPSARPAPRLRNGSSASSSLDSQDELDRLRDDSKISNPVASSFNGTATFQSDPRKADQQRFKGYIL